MVTMNNLKNWSFIFLFLLTATALNAQQASVVTENVQLRWKVLPPPPGIAGNGFLTFDDAITENVASKLPAYSRQLLHDIPMEVSATVQPLVLQVLTPDELACINTSVVPYSITPRIQYFTRDRKPASRIIFSPLIRNAQTGEIQKVVEFSLTTTTTPSTAATLAANYQWATTSVLEKGDWIRVEISKNGVYKLDVSYLKQAGLDVDGKDISTLRLYGNGGAMLAQPSNDPKNDDLVENPIEIKDNNQNGKFDGSDYLLFYGEGAGAWDFDNASLTYKRRAHRYADKNYYYVTVGAAGGKRLQTQSSEPGSPVNTTAVFDDLFYHERDDTNFLKSGREWFGEEFDKTTSYDFAVNIPDRVDTEPIRLRSQAVARSQSDSKFSISANGQFIMDQLIGPVYFSYESDFIAAPDTVSGFVTISGNPIQIRYTYNKPQSSSRGWLNFFEVVARRQLKLNGGQVIFRDSKTLGTQLTQFKLDANNMPNTTVWEITNPIEPKHQQTTVNGQEHSYNLTTNMLRTFVAFSDNFLLKPDRVEKVENQNLHALRKIDMVIVSYPDFVEEAERLAKHHEDHDGLTVAVVTPQQIYHEFSAGKQDVTAIRNFMKMLYDEPQSPTKYLLMFGDASYDYKSIKKNNTNFVPTYQSRNIYSPVYSYCSDDYFTHLDDNEGQWDESGSLHETIDIGVGRMPIQKVEQAKQMVDKVIAYNNAKTFGEWRNNVCFIADDEDNDLHYNDAQNFSAIVEKNHKVYNVDKIYMDAYKQVSVGTGARYPEVNDLFVRKIQRGSLIVNYNGHGGELGLAHEQILDIPMINKWDNINNMPLFLTATCEFSRFDDPGRVSAGEQVLLNPNGGGIALLTTVRLVYAWPNAFLNKAFYSNNVFALHDGKKPRLGDIYRRTKNDNPDLNNRNFTLLGDPAVMLNYPEHTVVTTQINGKPVSNTSSDTLGALKKITVKGMVQDAGGNKLTSFNGVVYPTVFDKPSRLSTLANDPSSSKQNFSMYKNIIYKGKATVKNGDFEFSFIVPEDISYTFGSGRISYYATNNTTDAHGYFDSLIITGTDQAAPIDNEGPTIKLYMNDTTFRFGGITDENPTLLAIVSDKNGINTTGTGVGRDITAILDGNRRDMLILNDYYQAKLDSYQEGEVRYPFKDLEEGHHNIRVKVWDVYHSSAEAYTEFLVAKSDKLAIKSLMNYPNPFSEKTTFYFEHNKQGQELSIEIDIYDSKGMIIKSLSTRVENAGANFDGLVWTPSSDYGNYLSQGLYLFKVKVRSGDDTVEETEKMVLIK